MLRLINDRNCKSSLEYKNFNIISEQRKFEEKISVLAQRFLQETKENQRAIFLFAGREIYFAEYRSCAVQIPYSHTDMDKKKLCDFFFCGKKKIREIHTVTRIHIVVRTVDRIFLSKIFLFLKKKIGKIFQENSIQSY